MPNLSLYPQGFPNPSQLTLHTNPCSTFPNTALAELPRMEPENEDAEDLTLAQAITLLARLSRHSPNSTSACTKIREPDTFDGSNPRKLRSFIVQCQLDFNNHPGTFQTDRAKINYAISFLKAARKLKIISTIQVPTVSSSMTVQTWVFN
ncbi:hypothetical protein SERLADRAFT_405337 [Serpula lacrymans var. lacrymans S7.9]|uniref:Uncharacterized protein n=1 Tax=Serpula lacrymans var. lacrymans (strain S7.9) TaxID=578457 RepID=F8NIC5_SERL9|nr:uncharacterized protein SERLADRAFT_405337 [Serpula lacrymans var. lacrymans S7.9]EGO29271.1 hypothetical protein SERLADRAFT_405337 [Serpula lacrymans var. lacrymans S7.9]